MNWEKTDSRTARIVQTALFQDLSEEEQAIVSALRQNSDGIQVNELALKLIKPISKISSLLLELEFKGLVKCLPGGMYRIIK
jgi:DNA processing protein